MSPVCLDGSSEGSRRLEVLGFRVVRFHAQWSAVLHYTINKRQSDPKAILKLGIFCGESSHTHRRDKRIFARFSILLTISIALHSAISKS